MTDNIRQCCCIVGWVVLLGVMLPGSLMAQEADDLAAAAQNPIADLISLPFQNNMTFDYGPDDDIQNVLNIQPVWPFGLGEDWNLITRTILPVVSQPHLDGSGGSTFGLGDTIFTAWFSPSDSKGLVWGVGPVVLLPTATDDRLGADQWGGGASAVALIMSGPWVAGGLINNIWGFGGSDDADVNQFLLQPFVNYNLDDGWYIVTGPVITANWEADSGNRWTVPVGGGMGKVFRMGKQPVNINTQVFYNVEKPAWVGDWTWRLQFQLLFPK